MRSVEVNSILVPLLVAGSAVFGVPHDIKGLGIYPNMIPNAGKQSGDALKKVRVAHARREIGPIATPKLCTSLPACPGRAAARSCAASCVGSP